MRERAEAEVRQCAATFEHPVAERTDELATFFDLTLLAGQAADLSDVFEHVAESTAQLQGANAWHVVTLDGTYCSWM